MTTTTLWHVKDASTAGAQGTYDPPPLERVLNWVQAEGWTVFTVLPSGLPGRCCVVLYKHIEVPA